MKRPLILKLWSLCVGAMDACTGIMLVTAPAFTLRLMSVPSVNPESLVFLSWMGVFIAGVGLSHVLVLRGAKEGETVWISTAIIRWLVALFLTVKISSGILPGAWAIVAVTDGLVATGQILLVRAGWWKSPTP